MAAKGETQGGWENELIARNTQDAELAAKIARHGADEEILQYLVHSRVTEQRAFEEVSQQEAIFRGDPELGKTIAMIASDEVDHLGYCNEELLRFARAGHGDLIRRMREEYALVEIRTYRDVSRAVMKRMGDILGWSKLKRGSLVFGIHAICWSERLWTWRRMTTLTPPQKTNPMGGPGSGG